MPEQFKAFRKVHKGLIRKYEGPFPVERRVGNVSYQLGLPQRLKIHPVFHVSRLKAYHADKEDTSRGESRRAPTAMITSFDKRIDEILTDRGRPPNREFLIKWLGLPESETTWEKEADLWQFEKMIEEYDQGLTLNEP
ncbi:hypothetical protein RND81_03G008800 [Saponaria officinalis]|uniref:Chromo domain-containing protein n=1 Tax=Saponaria officinalis TaxID=3572 RepID=A0AAW1M6J3_SAPOF